MTCYFIVKWSIIWLLKRLLTQSNVFRTIKTWLGGGGWWHFSNPESVSLCWILALIGILLGNLTKGLYYKSKCVSFLSLSHMKPKDFCVSNMGFVPDLSIKAKGWIKPYFFSSSLYWNHFILYSLRIFGIIMNEWKLLFAFPAIDSFLCLVLSHGIHLEQQLSRMGIQSEVAWVLSH